MANALVTGLRALKRVPYPWVVVFLCIITATSGTFAQTGIGVLFPFIQEELGTTRAQLGLIMSVMLVGATATGLLSGWMADVVGARRLQTVTRLGVAAGVLAFSQVTSLTQALLIGLFMGIAHAPSYANVTKAISDWVRPRNRGLAMGIEQASITLSGVVAAVLLTALAVALDWRIALIFAGVVVVIGCVIFYAFYRDRPRTEDGSEARRGPLGHMGPVLRNRELWLASLFGAAFQGFHPVLGSFLILFLREDLGMSAVAGGSLLGAAMGGGAVGRIGWGLISDIVRGGRVLTLVLVSMLSGVFMLILVWLPADAPLGLVLVVVFLTGLTGLSSPGLHAVLIAELAGPGLTGTAMGFTIMINNLGGFAVVPIFGLIVDQTGSYDYAWGMMAGLAVVATAFLCPLLPGAWARKGGEPLGAGPATGTGR